MKPRVRAMVLAWACVLSCASGVTQDATDLAMEAAVQRAAKARDEGRHADIKREIGPAAAIAGNQIPRRRAFAAQLLDHGFAELAAQLCTQTLPQAPDDPLLHGILGMAYLKMHRSPEAVAALSIATAKEPGRKEWWLHLGRAHLAANQEAQALAAIDRARALAPDDTAVLEVQAECEYRNMRLAQCETTSQALVAKSPKNALGWQLLIRVRRIQGRLEEARGSADDALNAMGRHPDIVLERGLVLLAENRNEEAVRELREVADRLPTDPRPHLHLCKAYARLGQSKEAATAKTRYVELTSDLPKSETRKSN